MEDIPHIGRNMVKLIDCFVYLISLSPSIRWTMMLWSSACQRRMVSDGPRLIGFALILCYCPQTVLFDWVISVLSAVVSLRAPCSDRCCSCSTRVSLLPISAYLTSTLYTWGLPSTVAQQRRQMELSVERIAQQMGPNRLRLNPEKKNVLWCATRRRSIHRDTDELSVCGGWIRPSTSLRDLGVRVSGACGAI